MKRLLSYFLALVIVLSMSGVTASAATVIKASRINVYSSTNRVRVGRTLMLDFKVYPDTVDYDSIEWFSDEENVAQVDSYGEVSGIAPGDAIISVRLYGSDSDNKTVRLGSGSISITVVSNLVHIDNPETDGGTKQTQKDVRESYLGGKISAAEVTSAVKEAVVKGKTTKLTFADAGSVSATALRSAATAAQSGGGAVSLNFDTMNSDKVEGRLTIYPERAKELEGDIKLGVRTNSDVTGTLRKRLEEAFKNKFTLVKADQSGSFGMYVKYAVKSNTPVAREKDLRLYSYNTKTSKYTEIKDANISLDVSGYVHFTTHMGGYLIVSDGALTRYSH